MIFDDLAGILAVFLLLLLLVAAGLFTAARFHECRAHGFSALYCVGQ